MYRYTPRENDGVNGPWMCDYGRLNYKWIQREDRLKDVLVRGEKSSWTAALSEIAEKRGLKPLTIEEHIAALIEEGREINIADLVSDADRALIEGAAKICGLERLRPIRDELPERIDYTAIRFVVADLRRRQKA